MHQWNWAEFSWYCGSPLIIQHFYKCIILTNDVLTHLHSTFGLSRKLKIMKTGSVGNCLFVVIHEGTAITCVLLSITSSFETPYEQNRFFNSQIYSNLDKVFLKEKKAIFFLPMKCNICLIWKSICRLVTSPPKLCCHFTSPAQCIFPKPEPKLERTSRDLQYHERRNSPNWQ